MKKIQKKFKLLEMGPSAGKDGDIGEDGGVLKNPGTGKDGGVGRDLAENGGGTCENAARDRGIPYNAGRIVLRAEYVHSHVKIYVIDHGPGIPDAEKKLIFDRFYRKDKSRRQKEHFGLGLSVAAKLAEIQGIGLDVEDTEGGGSTFRVTV